MSGYERKMPPMLRPDGMEKHRHAESHHRRPKAQEKKVAAELGGKRVQGSGSGEEKGDVARDGTFSFRIECKRSMGKESISLKATHLTKITAEANGVGAHPAIDLQFDKEVMQRIARATGRTPACEDWVAVPLDVFREMLEALEATEI